MFSDGTNLIMFELFIAYSNKSDSIFGSVLEGLLLIVVYILGYSYGS